jgi:hypothetical protein
MRMPEDPEAFKKKAHIPRKQKESRLRIPTAVRANLLVEGKASRPRD